MLGAIRIIIIIEQTDVLASGLNSPMYRQNQHNCSSLIVEQFLFVTSILYYNYQ